jgi:hypothetical protein
VRLERFAATRGNDRARPVLIRNVFEAERIRNHRAREPQSLVSIGGAEDDVTVRRSRRRPRVALLQFFGGASLCLLIALSIAVTALRYTDLHWGRGLRLLLLLLR